MKYIIRLIAMVSFLSSAISCDYLDKAPGVDVTEDDIFSSVTEVETLLASIYQKGVHSNLGYGSPNNAGDDTTNPHSSPWTGRCDESEQCAPWYEPNEWNSASVSADKTDDRRWSLRWEAIRKVALMIKRVDDVPGISPSYANQLKAESRVIRALNYFEMLKFYGGVPIIDHFIEVSEELSIPRSSVAEVVDFIVTDCEEALQHLPDAQRGSLRGRVDKGVALALRSKALLYAASPLFNTDVPYMDFGENNGLICYGEYDPARWEDAALAAKECLDWAEENGCRLIDDQGTAENYRYSWEHYDNAEIIFAEKAHGALGKWTWPWSSMAPPNVYPGNAGQSGITVTLNHVRKYENRDGSMPVWNGGNDLQAKMAALDPRFEASITGNLGRWNSEFPALELFEGGKQANTCYGGFWLHKHYPSEISDVVWQYVPNSTLFQLNEIYLNYAEAMNEVYGPDNDNGYGMTAREAVDKVRSRSGMPALPDSGKEQFREQVRHERDIELAFDNHRFWDIRRWMIAEEEGVMQGNMWGIRITKIEGNSREYHYEPYVFETRSWNRRGYLHPFSTNEVNKGYLLQNPGY
ncbi:MAG: RagB/SusD family nutrient uptake outer membrane protein [Bacteroidales bacterium]|nr:RagB/SusD family nutrient uptake outer membrane protein [Bacteroidales bacterium]